MAIRLYAFSLAMLGVAESAAFAGQYKVLHQFDGRDGALPQAQLIFGPHGELYGTATVGGNGKAQAGTVFELTPPPESETRWKLTTLWEFRAGEGAYPTGSLVLDPSGALFGSTSSSNVPHGFGTIFKLSPPAAGETKWQFQKLYGFASNAGGAFPNDGLVEDGAGALYGTSFYGGFRGLGQGTVFKLTPPAQDGGTNGWSFQVLTHFRPDADDGGDPNAPLLLDAQGVLYGTTYAGGGGKGYGQGTAYTLTPPAPGLSHWTRRTIAHFDVNDASPVGGLVPGRDGALYGNAQGLATSGRQGNYGAIFRLVPPKQGDTKWKHQILALFDIKNGAYPVGTMTGDGAGGFYGVTNTGGVGGGGVLFDAAPPADGGKAWSITVVHDFGTQKSIGSEGPAPVIRDASGALYGVTFSQGHYGDGTIFQYTP